MLRTALRSALIPSVTRPTAYSVKRFTSTMSDKVIHAHSSAEYDSQLTKEGLVCKNGDNVAMLWHS
jgi:hypothetical protein